jgi:uncharacterized protein YukE
VPGFVPPRPSAPTGPTGDPGQLFAAARSFNGLADRADQLHRELIAAADGLDGFELSWKGPSSHQFAELLRALGQSLDHASQNFRQTGGALNQYAQKLQQAQEEERKAQIATGLGIGLTILAIAQLGLDPVNDAAAAGVDGGSAAIAAEAAMVAEGAAAEAATAFTVIADAAMVAVRGLGAFLVPHLTSAAFAGGQAVFVDLMATGRIDWTDVRNQVAFAGLIGIPVAGIEGASALNAFIKGGRFLVRDDPEGLLQTTNSLKNLYRNPDHQYNFNVLSDGPLTRDMAPEQLSTSPANSFASGKYDMVSSDRPYLLFKAGDRPNSGSYFSLEPPASEAQARIDQAIKPQWLHMEADPKTGILVEKGPYSDLTKGYVYVVDDPHTPVAIGPTGSQGGPYMGGDIQVYVKGAFDPNAPRLRYLGEYDLANPPDWVLQLRAQTP